MSELDLRRGLYRKVYAGFIWGKRINAASLEAEAWFWRLNAVADDYGNLPGDPARAHKETSGRRDVSIAQVEKWIAELVQRGLMLAYEAEGESYLHIVGFGKLQPAGNKNGRRVRRHPASPWDAEETAEESGGTRVNPGESGCAREIQTPSVSVSVSGSSSPPPAGHVTPNGKAAAVNASRGEIKPPEGRRAVFEAMVLAGVSERKAAELAANPHVRTEDVRKIHDRRRQAGKAPDGSLVTEIQTAARAESIRVQRKAEQGVKA
jgi:hypothetical protein